MINPKSLAIARKAVAKASLDDDYAQVSELEIVFLEAYLKAEEAETSK